MCLGFLYSVLSTSKDIPDNWRPKWRRMNTFCYCVKGKKTERREISVSDWCVWTRNASLPSVAAAAAAAAVHRVDVSTRATGELVWSSEVCCTVRSTYGIIFKVFKLKIAKA